MARAYGSRAQLGFAFEATYGSSPGSGWAILPFASGTFGARQDLIENELLGYGRDPLAPIAGVTDVGGDVTVPVDAEAIGYWLKGLFGAPTTTGTGPYTHTFQSGATSLPSFSLEAWLPEVPVSELHVGVRANSIEIEMQPGDSQLQARISYVGQGVSRGTSSVASGAGATTPTLIRFGHFNGALTRNGAALGSVVGARLNYSNNLEPVRVIRGDGLVEDVDPTIASLTGSIDVRFADTILLDQAANGDTCELVFSWTRSTGESLTITAHSVSLPHPQFTIDGPGGVQATFDWQASRDATVGRMATVELVNNVAGY